MKIVIQLVLWVVIGFLGFKVYDSVNSSVKFQEVKQERFSMAVAKLKQIRKAQGAYKTVTGKYAQNYEKLAQFIDTAKFTIKQQRDSSFVRFDKQLRIDRSVDTVVFDILGYESIKDSLFSSIDYRSFNVIEYGEGKTAEVKLASGVVEKNEILYPVYKAEVAKQDLLADQKPDYVEQELKAKSLEEINGTHIFVGSLDEINTNGNWPIVYDK